MAVGAGAVGGDRQRGDDCFATKSSSISGVSASLRRNGWRWGAELEQAAARSTKVGNEQMPYDVRRIRSYVPDEGDGSVGTVCVPRQPAPRAVRRHRRSPPCR